ncbi:MAG: hypothetical protein Q4F47_08150 [Bacteroidaceae bacterium]|nr:hypothetical protein [Bacteroidaceae bacterium]
MRKVAASKVYINEKEFYVNHVVELFNHLVINHYPLTDEQPMTEWLGGTIIIRNQKAYHISQVLSSAELSAHNSCSNSNIQRL